MKNLAKLLLVTLIFVPTLIFAQPAKIAAKWYSIDEDGNKKSLVSIYKTTSGTYEGVIEKLLTGDTKRKCVNCTGTEKDKPIEGMKVLKGFKADGEKLTGGTILDPANGKIYHCTIQIDKKTGKLKVRGTLDKTGFIGRNQIWEPAGNK